MGIFLSTIILASLFLILGGAFAFESFKKCAFGFLRSKRAAHVLVGIAGAWFLWILYNLTEADFGQYKFILMAIFGGAAALSFKYLPDFLSVRGLSVLALLSLREFVNSAYMLDEPYKAVFVSYCYALVVIFIYFGCLPYRMRDFFECIYAKPIRVKILSTFFVLSAAALFLTASTYK